MKLNVKEHWIKMKSNKKVLLAVFGMIAILFVIVLLFWGKQHFLMDSRTVKVKDPKDLREQVQKDADDSMFNVRINSQIEMESLDGEAPLYIRNTSENKYDTYVELISDETDEIIYKSPKLKPGESVLKDYLPALNKTEKHSYTAYFHILEKGKEISSIEYAVTIEVKPQNE